MKRKSILLVVMVSFLVLPFLSNSAMATVGDLWDYDTGVPVEGTDALVTLHWEGEACEGAFLHSGTDVLIEYRHTTPKSAEPGWFDLPAAIDGTFEYDWDLKTWVWYGTAQFWSHIDPSASRGTNHGDITITWYNGDVWSWSFNVRHRV